MKKSLIGTSLGILSMVATGTGCSDDATQNMNMDMEMSQPLPPAAAGPPAAGGGSTAVSAPTLLLTLKDRFEEGWLASPAVADA